MIASIHRLLLRIYRLLPRWARRRVVRTIAPSFTVGAICMIEHDRRLLLVRQSYRARWGIPGGLLQRGETATAAAVREVREEVGLEVELLGEPAVVVDADPRRVDVVFRARPANGCDPDSARPSSPEVVEVRWFPLSDLPELQHESAFALATLARADR
ncbi:MAG: 8-oxo-dGTP diphosphatase [Acidimicrobiaceae bacterium]